MANFINSAYFRPGPRPTEGGFCMFPALEVLGLVEIPRPVDDRQDDANEQR